MSPKHFKTFEQHNAEWLETASPEALAAYWEETAEILDGENKCLRAILVDTHGLEVEAAPNGTLRINAEEWRVLMDRVRRAIGVGPDEGGAA